MRYSWLASFLKKDRLPLPLIPAADLRLAAVVGPALFLLGGHLLRPRRPTAVKGEAFIIAKAGKPLVRVSALDAPEQPNRLGFIQGEVVVPDDFNQMGEAEIAELFASDA